jgi:hypothetical protein
MAECVRSAYGEAEPRELGSEIEQSRREIAALQQRIKSLIEKRQARKKLAASAESSSQKRDPLFEGLRGLSATSVPAQFSLNFFPDRFRIQTEIF